MAIGAAYGRRIRQKLQAIIQVNSGTYTAEAGYFASLSTIASVNDDGQNSATPGTTEPTATNGYARQAFTWVAPTLPTNDSPAVISNTAGIAFTSTGGGFSTGATLLQSLIVYNVSTLATVTEAVFVMRAPLSTPVAVNATGITVSIAASAMTNSFGV